MFQPGQRLDRFVLLSLAGEGGQGAVWKASDTTRGGAACALKLMAIPRDGGDGSGHTARLRREAQALSRLRHESLVRCHGLFEDYATGTMGLVLDWVEGRPLGDAAADPRMTYDHKLFLLRHLVFALSRLHEEGLVHRDIKYANVLVANGFFDSPMDSETVKLVDLGVVVPVHNPRPITDAGAVVGTVAYMAPELADATHERALSANPAADVFAFGVLGWRLLTGEHPTGLGFDGDFMQYFLRYRSVLHEDAPWPARGEVQGLWGGLLRSCLALRLEERPASGADLRDTIDGATLKMPPVRSVVKPSHELAVGFSLPDASVASRRAMGPHGTMPLAAHPGPRSVAPGSVLPMASRAGAPASSVGVTPLSGAAAQPATSSPVPLATSPPMVAPGAASLRAPSPVGQGVLADPSAAPQGVPSAMGSGPQGAVEPPWSVVGGAHGAMQGAAAQTPAPAAWAMAPTVVVRPASRWLWWGVGGLAVLLVAVVALVTMLLLR